MRLADDLREVGRVLTWWQCVRVSQSPCRLIQILWSHELSALLLLLRGVSKPGIDPHFYVLTYPFSFVVFLLKCPQVRIAYLLSL